MRMDAALRTSGTKFEVATLSSVSFQAVINGMGLTRPMFPEHRDKLTYATRPAVWHIHRYTAEPTISCFAFFLRASRAAFRLRISMPLRTMYTVAGTHAI